MNEDSRQDASVRRRARAGLHLDRLGPGEWLNGVGSVALIGVVFLTTWFTSGASAAGEGVDSTGLRAQAVKGWASLGLLSPLTLLTCSLGVLVFAMALTRGSPALPMALAVLQAPFALAVVIALLLRVVVYPPLSAANGMHPGTAMDADAGAYFGVALGLAVAVGVYLTFRREGTPAGDSPHAIEVVDVSETSRASRA